MDLISAVRGSPASIVAPTGTVSLLFTDIEGSTTRWERHSTAMQDAVRRHDCLVRNAIECDGGYIFKTVGDAFCAAFARPDDAIRAAVGVANALNATDFSAVGGLRVRIAIHTGTTYERDGDYFGPTVNRVARLLAAGHGGQILTSGICAELARDLLPKDFEFVDLGEHKLKDLDRAEHIFQVDSAGRGAKFGALRTQRAQAHNVPAALTSFVGREREVSELDGLLRQHRVITIVGSGGIGKTRISAQVATLQVERFADGVVFVEIAPLTDGSLIPNTIAALIGTELTAGGDPIGSLVAALRPKCLLLVIDNCEHLIDAAARVIAAIAGSCPAISILATSRQRLDITGEHAYRMPTLTLPAANIVAAITADTAVEFEAIRLFCERAVALDTQFALTDANAPVIAEICCRLDGIALAIELAAARVRVLTPIQLRDRLDKRLKLLINTERGTAPRQQTLRALIDWSFDFLAQREQTVFCRLGIFADGFSLEAATAVCASADSDEIDMLDLLSSLVDKSLVGAEIDGTTTRFRLLESTRAYALMKLEERHERAAIAMRHLRYYLELVVTAEHAYEQTGSDRPLFTTAREIDNIRAALAYAFDDGDRAALGASLLGSSRHLWRRWTASAEGIDRCERAASAGAPSDAAATARLWNVASFLAYKTGRTVHALAAAQRAVPQALACGDPVVTFDALLCRALALMFLGHVDEAQADLLVAEDLFGRAPAPTEGIRLIEARGILRSWRHEYAQASLAFAELAAIHRANGNLEGEVHAGSNLAECEHARDHTREAIRVVRRILPIAQTLGDHWYASLLANLAGYFAAEAAVAQARVAARNAIELSTTDPGAPLVANALEHFALALAMANETDRAARLLGYCNATRAANGFRRQHTEQLTNERLTIALNARYTPAELAEYFACGAALSPSDAVSVALNEPVASS